MNCLDVVPQTKLVSILPFTTCCIVPKIMQSWRLANKALEHLLSEFVVTTGLRLYYDAPRRYDAETVTTGMSVSHALVVPPNQKDWITVGECSKECTAVCIF